MTTTNTPTPLELTPAQHELKTVELMDAMRDVQLKIAGDMPQGFVLAATARLLGAMTSAMFCTKEPESLAGGINLVATIVADSAATSYNAIRAEMAKSAPEAQVTSDGHTVH